MSFKLQFNASIKKELVTKVLQRKFKLVRENIKNVLRNEAFPHLITLIMKGYDSLSDRGEKGPDDPTSPSRWRPEFLAKLHKDLEDTFIATKDIISVKIGDRDFLGYDPSGVINPDDTQPLHWLVFYIEGLIGDWAFITPDDYNRLTRGNYETKWGRFSQGFMVSKEDYQEQGWDRTIPFSQVRHPFSGFAPLDIFTEALNEFKIRPFIQKAIDAAIRGKRV